MKAGLLVKLCCGFFKFNTYNHREIFVFPCKKAVLQVQTPLKIPLPFWDVFAIEIHWMLLENLIATATPICFQHDMKFHCATQSDAFEVLAE